MMGIDAGEMAGLLPRVPADSNKYTRGSVLVIGGSSRYTGAPILAAMAAARSGAGYTSVMVPRCMELAARSHLLSVPVICPQGDGASLSAEPVLDAISQLGHIDCIVIGPGLGVSPQVARMCWMVLERCDVPIVADADALNCIAGMHVAAGDPSGSQVLDALRGRGGKCVLTPHDGELARLAQAVGICPEGLDRSLLARQLAEALGCVVVAKGGVTRIVSPTGRRSYSDGTPALAKAGTGDVLAGMIGSFAAQGLALDDASALAVFAHGLAGKLAEDRLGTLSVMAEDVVDAIPHALVSLGDGKAVR